MLVKASQLDPVTESPEIRRWVIEPYRTTWLNGECRRGRGTWTGNVCSALTGKSGKRFRGSLAQVTIGKLDAVLGMVTHLLECLESREHKISYSHSSVHYTQKLVK